MAKQKKQTKKTKHTDPSIQETSKRIEKQFDAAMHDTHELIDRKITPQTRKTLTSVGKTAEAVADTVECIGEGVESITNGVFPSQGGSSNLHAVDYSSKVSRLFIFRVFWLLLQIPIISVWKVWICIVSIIHRIIMFLEGRRSKKLRSKQVRFVNHVLAWKLYICGMTDARPDILYREKI